MFRGGGWSEDLLLRYSAANTADQIAMIKNLGLNGIDGLGFGSLHGALHFLPANFLD